MSCGKKAAIFQFFREVVVFVGREDIFAKGSIETNDGIHGFHDGKKECRCQRLDVAKTPSSTEGALVIRGSYKVTGPPWRTYGDDEWNWQSENP